jgi:glycosyltransferase involved in cell wall biosynthesis
MPTEVEISVVVPVRDEEENVAKLIGEIRAALSSRPYEMIFVDDASRDRTLKVLKELRRAMPELRVVRHPENCGQSSAIRTGVFAAHGRTVVVLDGDGQNDPADIPALLERYGAPTRNSKLALVMGQRLGRQDSWAKRSASRFANWLRNQALQDRTSDTGCGLKVFAREAFLRLPYFHGMHRFMPALMLREGYEIDFVPVRHRAREKGRSKYGVIDRALQTLPDLFGVMWLRSRTRLPSDRIEL